MSQPMNVTPNELLDIRFYDAFHFRFPHLSSECADAKSEPEKDGLGVIG